MFLKISMLFNTPPSPAKQLLILQLTDEIFCHDVVFKKSYNYVWHQKLYQLGCRVAKRTLFLAEFILVSLRYIYLQDFAQREIYQEARTQQ